jgi:hypothetical protein
MSIQRSRVVGIAGPGDDDDDDEVPIGDPDDDDFDDDDDEEDDDDDTLWASAPQPRRAACGRACARRRTAGTADVL